MRLPGTLNAVGAMAGSAAVAVEVMVVMWGRMKGKHRVDPAPFLSTS